MIVECPECSTRYRVDEGQIPPSGRDLRCGGCAHVFRIAPPPLRSIPLASADGPAKPVAGSATGADPATEAGPCWLLETPGGDETLDRAALRDRIRAGALDEEDLLRPASGGEPVPAGEVPELQRYFRLRRGSRPPAAAAGPSTATASCTAHPGMPASHVCPSCHVAYCSGCVEEREFGNARVKWCARCEDRCVPCETSGPVTPFWREIPRLLAYPLAGWGPFMLLCCAVLSTLGAWLPGPGKVLYFLVLAYQLHILAESARGKRDLPDWPDTSDFWEITSRGLKGLLVTVVAWLPVILFNVLLFSHLFSSVQDEMGRTLNTHIAGMEDGRAPGEETPLTDYVDEEGNLDFDRYYADLQAGETEEPDLEEMQAALEGPLGRMARVGFLALIGNLLLVPLVLLYYPMCLMITAIFNTITPALNPALILRCIARIKGDYAIALVFCAGLAVGGFVVQALLSIIPLAGAVLGAMIAAYLTFVQMHILGWTAHQGWDRLNWDIQI